MTPAIESVTVTMKLPRPIEVRGVGSYSNTGMERAYTATSVTATADRFFGEDRITVWFTGSVRAFQSSDPAIITVKRAVSDAARSAWLAVK